MKRLRNETADESQGTTEASITDLRISPAERLRRRSWHGPAIAVALATVAASAWLVVSRSSASPPEVRVASVASAAATGTAAIVASGYVEAEEELDVASRIVSTVIAIPVDEGSTVAKGDVLVRLDAKELDAQLAESEAVWSHARARLERAQKLHADGIESSAALEEADAAERSSLARVDYARVQLAHTVLRAPFAGVVTRRYVHVGEVVSPFGTVLGDPTSAGPLLTLVDFSTLHVAADVGEAQIRELREGRAAIIELEAYPGAEFPGELARMARSADRQRGTLTASVRFLARDERVMPGLSARVRFVADPRAELDAGTALTMPSSALVDHNGQSGVFVVRDDVVEFREIRVGARDGGRVEVSSGLRAGELVVAPADADVLRTGLKVRVSGRALP